MSTYSVTIGIRLIRSLLAQGKRTFSVYDAWRIAQRLGKSRSHLRKILYELAVGGWIKRLRRGTYVITMETPSESDIQPFVISRELVKPSAISHWSALSFHDFTEQIPKIVTATTTKKVVTPSMRQTDSDLKKKHMWKVDQTYYEYVSVKQSHFFGFQEVWIDQFEKILITDKERTIIDCFAFPRRFGGIQWVISTLEEIIDQLDIEKLVSYAIRYGRTSVIKRLGWALSEIGVQASALKALRDYKTSTYFLIDLSRERKGSYQALWKVIDNREAQVI